MLNGEIIEQYPGSEPYPSCLIMGWLASGDPLHIVCSRGEAEPALRKALIYDPSLVDAAEELGDIAFGAGRYDDAAFYYRGCVKRGREGLRPKLEAATRSLAEPRAP